MIKNIFILMSVLLLNVSASVQAQETDQSLLSGNKVWTLEIKGVLPSEYGDVYWYEETRLDGDTIIDGIHFKRKYIRIWKLGEAKPDVWTPLSEYLGQDGDKVYLCSREFYNSPLGAPQLIMDFSAKPGDNVYIGTSESGESYTVTDISNMVISDFDDKSTRRCLHVRYATTTLTDEWIEGIGSLLFGVSTTSPGVGAFTHLYRCVDGDRLFYQWDTIDAIDDAPRLMNNEEKNNEASAVYDLQGRRLAQKPTKGVYIQNGKKVAVN